MHGIIIILQSSMKALLILISHYREITFAIIGAILLIVVSGILLLVQAEKSNKVNTADSTKDRPVSINQSVGSDARFPLDDNSKPIKSNPINPPTPTPTANTTPPPNTTTPTPTSSGPILTPLPINRDTSYDIGVMVISYFPLTSDGQKIDSSVTGDIGDSFQEVRQKTQTITSNLTKLLSKATQYRGYDHPSPPSIIYTIKKNYEHTQSVPLESTERKPEYAAILNQHNICNAVKSQGIQEVWIWAYQGPTYPGTSYPYLNISESKMSGPHGDISNSWRTNDMPYCGKTYTVYTFNYGRGTAEAMHSWGHQIEAELAAVDDKLYNEYFQGPSRAVSGTTTRCGSVHNPPNSRHDYDYANPTPHPSDCLDWGVASLGNTTAISCQLWGCEDKSDSDNSHLNYMVWMWQNLPGRNNPKKYQGSYLRNWWDVHANFDKVMSSQKSLLANF